MLYLSIAPLIIVMCFSTKISIQINSKRLVTEIEVIFPHLVERSQVKKNSCGFNT